MKYPIILGIESSCDDTAAAVFANGTILSNVTNTQEAHALHGGVIPELASREHQKSIVNVVATALQKANIDKKDLDAIAFTRGPGLLGSLFVGVSFAKSLGQALDIPIIAVNHMKAHILAHFIDDPKPDFPFLCLTVSGGHTQLVLVKSPLEHEIVGKTIDDAVGEAFDKVAKMLGLSYPGGPIVDRLAKQGDVTAFKFAKPRIKALDFSFSGFKTSVLYSLQKLEKEFPNIRSERKEDICASVQDQLVTILLEKLEKAAKQYKVQHLALAGGVSANSELRQRFQELCEQNNWQAFIPQFQYCTDNAAMIAMAGYFHYKEQDFAPMDVVAKSRM